MKASPAGTLHEKGVFRANDHAEVLYATTEQNCQLSTESTPISLVSEGSDQSRDSWSMPGSPIANSDHARRSYASDVPRMSTSCPVIVTKQGQTIRERKRHRRPLVQLRCDYHLLDASRRAASPRTSRGSSYQYALGISRNSSPSATGTAVKRITQCSYGLG